MRAKPRSPENRHTPISPVGNSTAFAHEARVVSYPPVIEEWLRESRARLLRRYGGLVDPRPLRARPHR